MLTPGFELTKFDPALGAANVRIGTRQLASGVHPKGTSHNRSVSDGGTTVMDPDDYRLVLTARTWGSGHGMRSRGTEA